MVKISMICSISVASFGGIFLPPVAYALELITSTEINRANFNVFMLFPQCFSGFNSTRIIEEN